MVTVHWYVGVQQTKGLWGWVEHEALHWLHVHYAIVETAEIHVVVDNAEARWLLLVGIGIAIASR